MSRERDRIVGWASGPLSGGVKGLTLGLREPKRVAQTEELTGVEESEEDGEIGSPGEQTDDEGASVPTDLGWE